MVGFILAEGPGRSFPAEDVDAVFDDGGCDPAPGRRKVSLARPPIGCGVVFLGDAEVLAVLAVQTATHRVETAAERGGGMGGAGPRHRRAPGPAIGRPGIEPLPAGVSVPGLAPPPPAPPRERRGRQ